MEDPCPNCGYHKKPYLMASHPDAPGLLASLRGEGGEVRRIALTVAVCVFIVLAILAIEVLSS